MPRFSAVWVLLLPATAALAQNSDVVTLRSSVNLSSDDNFFKTPAAPVSERITTQSIGVNVALPLSLQRLELDASLTGNQHQTYTNFDYTGQNYSAAWRWSVTPQLHGSVTSSRAETLNAAGDSVDPTLRNKNTTLNNALDAAYDLGGPWQATAGLSSTNAINERPVIGQTDSRSAGYNVGLRLAGGGGNSLAYSFQNGTGSSTNDFKSDTHSFTGVWVLSGNTSLNGRMAYLQQRFGAAPQFDFAGWSSALGMSWRLTGKTSLSANWARDLTGYQTAGTTHSQTDSFTAGPAWQISPQTSLRLQYRNAQRVDQGNPYGTPTQRQDTMQDTSLSFGWQPRQFASLTATVGQSTRSSSAANADYAARTLALAAQFSF